MFVSPSLCMLVMFSLLEQKPYIHNLQKERFILIYSFNSQCICLKAEGTRQKKMAEKGCSFHGCQRAEIKEELRTGRHTLGHSTGIHPYPCLPPSNFRLSPSTGEHTDEYSSPWASHLLNT